MNKVRKATITNIVPSKFVGDDGKPHNYVGYVQATDETGEVHNFVNGSRNRVSHRVVQVGDEGCVEFISTGSMALWYWRSM